MREYDTTSTLIGLAVGAALVIHLFKWMGVLSVVFFIVCAACAPPPKETTLWESCIDAGKTGCGFVVLAVAVLLLAHLAGC